MRWERDSMARGLQCSVLRQNGLEWKLPIRTHTQSKQSVMLEYCQRVQEGPSGHNLTLKSFGIFLSCLRHALDFDTRLELARVSARYMMTYPRAVLLWLHDD